MPITSIYNNPDPSTYATGHFEDDVWIRDDPNQLDSLLGKDDFGPEALKSLSESYRTERAPVFRPANSVPSFAALKEPHCENSEGFNHTTLPGTDKFIHFERLERKTANEDLGNKVHISVKLEDLEQAYNAIADLLLSPDSPIDEWKLTHTDRTLERIATTTNPESKARSLRITQGAQFTLYIQPEKKGEGYSHNQLLETRHLLDAIETKLASNRIGEGVKPDSDVDGHHWAYVSYRNDKISDREGSAQQSAVLRQQPVFRALTE